jgi:hypothetical protein
VLLQDWHKDNQTNLQVKNMIKEIPDKNLPTATTKWFTTSNAKTFLIIYLYKQPRADGLWRKALLHIERLN